VDSIRKQPDDDRRFNTLNKKRDKKSKQNIQRETNREKKETKKQRRNNSSSSIDGINIDININISISSNSSAGRNSISRSLFGDGMRVTRCYRDRNRLIFIWMSTVFSIDGRINRTSQSNFSFSRSSIFHSLCAGLFHSINSVVILLSSSGLDSSGAKLDLSVSLLSRLRACLFFFECVGFKRASSFSFSHSHLRTCTSQCL